MIDAGTLHAPERIHISDLELTRLSAHELHALTRWRGEPGVTVFQHVEGKKNRYISIVVEPVVPTITTLEHE